MEILRHHGPMEVSDQRIQDVFALLPDNVHTFVKNAGGLYKFLQRWPEIRTDGKRLSLIEDDDVAAADDDEDDNEDARPERRQAKQKSTTTENPKVDDDDDDDDGLPYVPAMSDAYSPWVTTSDVSSERSFWPASHLSSSSVAIDGGREGEKVSKFMSFFDLTVGGGGSGGDNAKATLSSSAVQTDGGVVESRAVQTNDNFVVRVEEMEKELKKLEKEKKELAFKLDESQDKIVKLRKKMQVDAEAFQERVAAQVEAAKV